MSQPYKSGRQQNLNLGITSITENKTVLQTIGKVGIGTTNAQQHSLYVVGSTNIVGNSNVTGVGTFGSVNSNVGIFTNITATGFGTFGTLYVQNGATLFNDLLVYGNVSIAGTTVAFFAQDLRIKDKDLILGVTTAPGDPNGDYSTDNTANHGGIAIASTEGSYLVPLQKVGINSLPETYKQFMWSKHDTFGIGTTDAWLSNQAVGIGSTLVPNGVRLAVGDVKVTDNTVTATNGNFTNITGISASYTSGSFTNGYFGSLSSGSAFVNTGIVTNISGTNLSYSGIGTINTLNGTDATFTNVTATSITANRANIVDITSTGIHTANAYYIGATRVISSGRALENIASIDEVTKATFEAALENAPNNFSDLSVSGIATLNILGANSINVTGVVTARQFIGDVNAGVTTIGFATITSLYAGIGTIDGVKISNGIVTSSSPGVTTVKYYGDGSNLIGVNAFNVVNQVLTASPVYPTFANNIGVTSIGIADTEMGFIPTSGNLGIGSTNPTAKLNVVGNAIFTGIVTAQKFVGDIEATGPTSIISATNLYVSGIGTIDGVTISNGIVTSTQPGVTTVKYYGDGSNLIGVNAFNVIQQDIASSPVFPTFANSIGVSSIGIAVTQIGYVPASGNFGIGNTNPTSKLQVVGNVLVSGVTTARQFVGDVNAGIATINKLDVNQISPDGVDFGGPQYLLRATGSGTWEWASIPGVFSVNNILNGFNVYDEGLVVGTAGSITTLDFRGNNIIASADSQPNGIATVRVSDTPTFLNLTVTPGITTVGFITANNLSVSGVTTSGAYYVNGTQVISSARQLQNIASLDATTTATIEAAIQAAPNTFNDLNIVGVSTFNAVVLNGTVSTGSTVGASGQYLQSTGIGVTWATFPTLRTTQTNIATAGQTSFSFSYNVNFLDVFINGVKLTGSEYTAINGTSIILSSPAFVNDIVEFVSYNTTSVGGGGGGGASIIDDLSDVTLSLPPAVGENLTYNGTSWVNDYTVTATTSTVSQTSIHTLSASSYRSVEYVIQATQGTNYHATKILAIHDGSLAYPSEYGIIYTNGSLGDFDVDISGGNMRLLVTPTSSSSTTYKIKFTAIKI